MPRKKLTRVEILAVKAAVKTGLRLRHHIDTEHLVYPLFGRGYMRGYWAGIQSIVYALPDCRKTVRICRIYERCARSIKSYAPRACPSVPVRVSPCPPSPSNPVNQVNPVNNSAHL